MTNAVAKARRRVFTVVLCGVFIATAQRPGFATIELGPIVNGTNGNVYYSLAPATWDAAQAEAISLGGDLVTINDAAENDWLWAIFNNNQDLFWTGLNFQSGVGAFLWASGQPVMYLNWAPENPMD